MITIDKIMLLVPTLMAISLTPGLCMTLAFSLGLSIGFKRTLWMMLGELLGVALVVVGSALALLWVVRFHPLILPVLSVLGGGYLVWITIQLWFAKGQFGVRSAGGGHSRLQLALLGLSTAIMNPKGWAFMLALLPGFLEPDSPKAPQIGFFLVVMLSTETSAMTLYASGGRTLARCLGDRAHIVWLNRVAAVFMLGVSMWILWPDSLAR